MVPARLSVLTLGARDLASLKAFYAGFGWEPAIELEDFCAFGLQGAVLALFPLDLLTGESGSPAAVPESGFRGVSLSINVDEPQQIEEVLDAAREAGARVTKEPQTMEWGGRSAYFADPEDNHWEIAWVPPQSKMAELVRRGSG